MTCEAFKALLRDGAPKSPLQNEALAAHARRCAACAAERESIGRLVAALDALREETRAAAPRASLESELLAAFPRYVERGFSPVAPRVKRSRPWLAAAAALLLAAPAGVWFALSHSPSVPTAAHTAVAPARAGDNALAAARQPVLGEPVERGREAAESSLPDRTTRRPAQPPAAGGSLSATTATIDTAELRDAVMLPVLDGATDDIVHVVRVEVPRSALIDFGLAGPLVAERDVVAADVFVSEDGMPRAIRVAEPLQVLDGQDVQ